MAPRAFHPRGRALLFFQYDGGGHTAQHPFTGIDASLSLPSAPVHVGHARLYTDHHPSRCYKDEARAGYHGGMAATEAVDLKCGGLPRHYLHGIERSPQVVVLFHFP